MMSGTGVQSSFDAAPLLSHLQEREAPGAGLGE